MKPAYLIFKFEAVGSSGEWSNRQRVGCGQHQRRCTVNKHNTYITKGRLEGRLAYISMSEWVIAWVVLRFWEIWTPIASDRAPWVKTNLMDTFPGFKWLHEISTKRHTFLNLVSTRKYDPSTGARRCLVTNFWFLSVFSILIHLRAAHADRPTSHADPIVGTFSNSLANLFGCWIESENCFIQLAIVNREDGHFKFQNRSELRYKSFKRSKIYA